MRNWRVALMAVLCLCLLACGAIGASADVAEVIEVEMPFRTFGEPKPDKPWLWGLNRSHTRSSWTDGAFHSPNSFRVIHLEGLN